MNIALILPEPSKEGIGSVELSRLRSLVARPRDGDGSVKAVSRPYSFLSECECPHHCLRDHENE